MINKMYFYLLILCGVWSQGIIESFADEENKPSSGLLVRKKRVISYEPHGDKPVSIKDTPYVVIIKQDGRTKCTGSILSNHVVITAAYCVMDNPEQYQIIAGQATSTRNINFNVTDIRRHSRIALLITPIPFVYSPNCYYIKLHEGLLLPGIIAKVSGWGYNWRCASRGTDYPTRLRSIEVPIMAHRECVNRYRPYRVITDKEVCTFHPQKHCGHTDFGTGLVVDGYLAGVHIWSGIGENRINPAYPDVFAILQHSDYIQWIRSNLENINAQFLNQQHPLFPQHN